MLALGASAAATRAWPPGFPMTCSKPAMSASVPALVDVVWSDEKTPLEMPAPTMTVPERSFSTYGADVDARANLETLCPSRGTDSSARLETFVAAVSTSSSRPMTAFSATPAAENEPQAAA